MTYPDGGEYVGEYKAGGWHGQGTMTYPDGDKYVGEYKDDKRHGQGTMTWPDGSDSVATLPSPIHERGLRAVRKIFSAGTQF